MTDEMKKKLAEVEEVAKAIYLMVDRVKEAGVSDEATPEPEYQQTEEYENDKQILNELGI